MHKHGARDARASPRAERSLLRKNPSRGRRGVGEPVRSHAAMLSRLHPPPVRAFTDSAAGNYVTRTGAVTAMAVVLSG